MQDDRAAIAAWQKEPDGPHRDAMLEEIIREKRGLIQHLTAKAARAEKTREDMDDLFQAGAIGFRRALDTFDVDRGLSISTYAAHWVRHFVQQAARKATTVALPRIRLTNEERTRAILALRDNPDVDPESIGIRRAQLEQVRHSIGVRYVPDDTPKGMRAIERYGESLELLDAEDALDRARAYRPGGVVDQVLARVRRGESAEQLGLGHEAHAAALEILNLDAGQAIKRKTTAMTTAASTSPAQASASARRGRRRQQAAPGQPASPDDHLRLWVASQLDKLPLEKLKELAHLLTAA